MGVDLRSVRAVEHQLVEVQQQQLDEAIAAFSHPFVGRGRRPGDDDRGRGGRVRQEAEDLGASRRALADEVDGQAEHVVQLIPREALQEGLQLEQDGRAEQLHQLRGHGAKEVWRHGGQLQQERHGSATELRGTFPRGRGGSGGHWAGGTQAFLEHPEQLFPDAVRMVCGEVSQDPHHRADLWHSAAFVHEHLVLCAVRAEVLESAHQDSTDDGARKGRADVSHDPVKVWRVLHRGVQQSVHAGVGTPGQHGGQTLGVGFHEGAGSGAGHPELEQLVEAGGVGGHPTAGMLAAQLTQEVHGPSGNQRGPGPGIQTNEL